ncbi:MAG: hypothetical protein OQJ98_02220 [Candidatus Pacebacteria bacterium]|nr:hypothetical protein [Candidatus Paceibacterota bacterium]
MESIREMLVKIKGFFMFPPADLVIVAIVILVGSAGFGLGRLSALEVEKVPVFIVDPEIQSASVTDGVGEAKSVLITGSEAVVGSKNSDKYHFPWCSGAQRIAEVNKVTFPSAAAARAAGYIPASNCEGLE